MVSASSTSAVGAWAVLPQPVGSHDVRGVVTGKVRAHKVEMSARRGVGIGTLPAERIGGRPRILPKVLHWHRMFATEPRTPARTILAVSFPSE